MTVHMYCSHVTYATLAVYLTFSFDGWFTAFFQRVIRLLFFLQRKIFLICWQKVCLKNRPHKTDVDRGKHKVNITVVLWCFAITITCNVRKAIHM